MQDKKRFFTIGAVWSLLLFGWWLPLFMIKNWGFNPYSGEHWRFIMNEFDHGWNISASSDWFFIGTLILILPIWIIGWVLCLRVKWKELFAKIRGKIIRLFRAPIVSATPQKAKFKPKGSHKKIRPSPMHTSAKAVSTNAAEKNKAKPADSSKASPAPRLNESQARASGALSDSHRPSFLSQDELDTPIEDIQLPAMPRLEEDLLDIIQTAGYQVIQGPMIGKKMFDYMAVDSEKIVFVLCDNEKGDWLVDEESFDNEAPLWFSETAHRTSPIFEMAALIKQFAEKLKKRDIRLDVVPLFVEKAGNIINADEMTAAWKKLNVTVCRTDLGGPVDLPGFKEALPPASGSVSSAEISEIQSLL